MGRSDDTRRSVAAIGGFNQIPDGIRAMQEAKYSGKVVIYPMVLDFPLCSIAELETRVPRVFSLLEDGMIWTQEAEREFLRAMGVGNDERQEYV